MMYCMVQWIKQLSLHLVETIFYYKVIKIDNKTNYIVNMVNGNDLIQHNYWPYLYFDVCFLNPDVYLLKGTPWDETFSMLSLLRI